MIKVNLSDAKTNLSRLVDCAYHGERVVIHKNNVPLVELGFASVTKNDAEHAQKDDETYFSFVKRAAADPIGRKVKLADISDNFDIKRLADEITDKHVARIRRYKRALAILVDTKP